jgi:hypothetical protein
MTLERLDALRVDLRRIHAGRPEITDDLLDASGGGVRRGLFRELALHGGRALVEHFECTPRSAITRNRVGREPLAVDVTAKIRAGILAGIEIADLEAVHRRQLAFVERERLGFGRCRRGGGVGCGRCVAFASRERERDGEGQQQDLRFVDSHLRTPARWAQG